MIYPRTPTGIASARERWHHIGGWLVSLRDGHRVTDDPEEAAQWVASLTGDMARARWLVAQPVLTGADPPVVDARLVADLVGRVDASEGPQLGLWGAS